MARKDHDFVSEFIEIYSNFPCLWKKCDPQYQNTIKKESCYQVLLEKYKEYNEEATVSMVKKKINSLRSAYNKEWKKVKHSDKSGAGADEIYTPTLWYYELFSFLHDQQTNRASINTIDPNHSSDTENGGDEEEGQSNTLENEDTFEENSTNSSDHQFPRPSTSTPFTARRKRSIGSEKIISNGKVLQLVANRLQNSSKEKSKYESFGMHIAQELSNMTPDMIPFVQKIINDAILQGQIKSLNKTSHIVTHSTNFHPIYQEPETRYVAVSTPTSSEQLTQFMSTADYYNQANTSM